MDDLKKIIKMLEEQKKSIDRIQNILESRKAERIESKTSESRTSTKISKKQPKSITGYITALKEDGFFDTPKTLKEISEELARQGYHYSTSSLTYPIQTLLRKRSVGRIISNGMWAYVKR